jgi:hypothetical protein
MQVEKNSMTHEQILSELEQLASNCGISIRYEKGDFDGGYCVLKTERLIVINKRLAPARRASVLAQGLAEVGIDEMYLKPVIREYIEDELAKAAKQ